MTQTHPLENLYSEELYSLPPKVLIVISKPWSEIQEDEKTLLGKILGAVKLSLSSVQIINRAEFGVDDFNSLWAGLHHCLWGNLEKFHQNV